MNDVLIIGGGIGGLFTGALLAKNGLRVTVLDKNATVGGGLQSFTRHGKIYDTGMHVMGGWEAGGSLHRLCAYLGILDRLDLHHIDPGCMDEVRYADSGQCYRLPSGREAFGKALTAYFPHEAAGIEAYLDCIWRLTDELPLFALRPDPSAPAVHSERFYRSADSLIAEFVTDPELRELLAYLNPLYSGSAGRTPAYVHAVVNVLFIKGSSRFVGGSQQLADALADVIRSHCGRVLPDSLVSEIRMQHKHITEVRTADGRVFSAGRYISSIHPDALLRLLPHGAMSKAFAKRIARIDDSCSAFSVFIDLKPESQPYIPHTCYLMARHGAMWDQHDTPADLWPSGLMFMTPPEPGQGSWADKMLVHCSMSFDEVSRWEHTDRPGRRGEEYERWKTGRIERVLDRLETAIPGFRDRVERVFAASPLTVRDYYHTRRGAIFGNFKDCNDLNLSHLQTRTKIPNLLLTGQNVNLHGICGVPLSAVTTAEAVLGRGYIINRIHHAEQNHHIAADPAGAVQSAD